MYVFSKGSLGSVGHQLFSHQYQKVAMFKDLGHSLFEPVHIPCHRFRYKSNQNGKYNEPYEYHCEVYRAKARVVILHVLTYRQDL